jgi:hypothetical protein
VNDVDPLALEGDAARISFWVNLYNRRLRESLAERPRSGHLLRHRGLFRRETFDVGGLEYTLDVVEHGVLRRNARPPYSLRRLLRDGDPRLRAAPSRLDPRIHFALNCGARSCPPIRTYSAEGLDAELEEATWAYVSAESRVDRERGELVLPGLVKLYRADFGTDLDLAELASRSLASEDAAWIRERDGEVLLGFTRFDWRLEG